MLRRPKRGTADIDELRRAADRLAEELRDVSEEELIEDFQQLRRRSKKVAHASSSLSLTPTFLSALYCSVAFAS
jgi:hypothetical protein